MSEDYFREHWLSLPHPAELKLADDILSEYGADNFVFALKQALEYKIKKIPYIRAICKKRKEKEAVEKEKQEARRKKLELEKQIEESRRQGVKLNLVEEAFGKHNTEEQP